MIRARITTALPLAALALTACAASVSSQAPAPAAPPAALRAAVEGISAPDVYARIEFLASDAMRGRNTPSPELNLAAAYLVNQHKLFGLRPAGVDGTFYQWWPYAPRRVPEGQAAPAPVLAPNVVAVLPGRDPALRGEYVVLSAHFDHVGVGRPVDGDSIYNGADDDASGTSALLEVAQALAALPPELRPRRSVAFVHVSGEEKGLLGSRYFSDHPTLPLAQVVANVNVDMIARNAPDSVVVIGKEYSTLGQVVDRVRERHPELGLVAADDIWPEERFFFRSDHFNFARKEVPALFFFSGVHEDYHKPSDEVERIDADKAARVSRMVFHTVYEIADAPGRPVWDPAGLEQVRSMTR